ncbi:hypothetical protein GQ600_21227 [Phytophthora cactorum]|nr:hypothetical protein GQ600_21227 [Phytophthora cactorum]
MWSHRLHASGSGHVGAVLCSWRRQEVLVKKCDKYDAGLGLCLAHGGGRDCTMNDCTKKAIRYGLCSGHGGRARCKVEGCEKYDRGQGKCKAHGGGYFCKVQGCNKKDKGGGLCAAHGGGKKCYVEGCTTPVLVEAVVSCMVAVDDAKLKAVAIGLSMEVDASNTAAQGSVALVVDPLWTMLCAWWETSVYRGGCERLGQARGLCKAHGGTKPCSFPDCTRKANSGGHCIRHGGGGRCKTEGCVKTNRGGGYCKAHGGGKKCTVPDCNDWAIGGGYLVAWLQAYKNARPELIDSTSAGDSGKRLALVNGRTSALEGCTGTARSGDGGRLRPSGFESGDGFGGSSERLPRNLISGTRCPDGTSAATAAAAGAGSDDEEVEVCADLLDPLGPARRPA